MTSHPDDPVGREGPLRLEARRARRWPLATASKKSRVDPQQPAGDQVQHEQERESGSWARRPLPRRERGSSTRVRRRARQRARRGEAAEHELQPEVDEHGRRRRAQGSHDGPDGAPDALRPQDLERLELDRLDLLLVAPAEPRLEPPERPQEAEQGREEEDGGRRALAGPRAAGPRARAPGDRPAARAGCGRRRPGRARGGRSPSRRASASRRNGPMGAPVRGSPGSRAP